MSLLKSIFKSKEVTENNAIEVKEESSSSFNERIEKNRKLIEVIKNIDENKLKYDVRCSCYKIQVWFMCHECGEVNFVDLNKINTKDEFIEYINSLNCCNENCKDDSIKFKERFNRIINHEEFIKENIKIGDRVKLGENVKSMVYPDRGYVRDDGEVKYGTLMKYTEYKNIIKSQNYDKIIVEDISKYKAIVLLDKGLDRVEVQDIKKLEKCYDKLDESEIRYISYLLNENAKENMDNEILVNINKKLVNKLNKE